MPRLARSETVTIPMRTDGLALMAGAPSARHYHTTALVAITRLFWRSSFMRQTWTFHSAGQLLFGRNAAQQLGDIAGRLGVRRALLVTDPILVGAGLAERVRGYLGGGGV